jgi:hypothetical protein
MNYETQNAEKLLGNQESGRGVQGEFLALFLPGFLIKFFV